MRPAGALLALCGLVWSSTGGPSRDFCSQILNSDVKPGFPKTIKTNDAGVLKAARHSVERFNNCTDDIFLFKESHISRALVQIVKGLKYMLDVEIGRTTCKKTKHPSLDNCDFQTNGTLKRVNKGVCLPQTCLLPSRPHPSPGLWEEPLGHFSASSPLTPEETGTPSPVQCPQTRENRGQTPRECCQRPTLPPRSKRHMSRQ